MNILVAHNFYQQPGGEDQVFADEVKLLRDHGHAVREFTVHNDAVESMGRVELARKTVWNHDSYRAIRDAVREHRAEIAHFHNIFPLISPAGYRAARDEGAAVVQTLHNYRLLCPAATFFRDGHVCTDCLGRQAPWPGVAHRCYRRSLPASAVVATMLTIHNARGTWQEDVDQYIALTEFAKRKLIEGGLDAGKIVVKPNFVSTDPGAGPGDGGYAIFVGRLVVEKGVLTMLRAWEGHMPLPLLIAGDGPLRAQVEAAAKQNPKISYLGRRLFAEVQQLMGRAEMLVFPSEWYEPFGRTIVEAYACGTPVVASDLGGMPELVQDRVTGLLFSPADAEGLRRAVSVLHEEPSSRREMRQNCRESFLRHFTAESNFPILRDAYDRAKSYAASRPAARRGAKRETI